MDAMKFLVNSPEFWPAEFEEGLKSQIDEAFKEAEEFLNDVKAKKPNMSHSEEFSIMRAFAVQKTRLAIIEYVASMGLGFQGHYENTYSFTLVDDSKRGVSLSSRYDPEA